MKAKFEIGETTCKRMVKFFKWLDQSPFGLEDTEVSVTIKKRDC